MTTSVASNTNNARVNTVDIKDAIVTLRKYKFAILLTAALVTLLVSLIVSSLTPVYRASATLLISPPTEKNLVSIDELVALDLVSNDYFQTQVEVLKSRKLARRVVRTLDLKNHWEYNKDLEKPGEFSGSGIIPKLLSSLESKYPELMKQRSNLPQLSPSDLEEQIITELLAKVAIRPLKETNLVRVSVDGVDPDLAKEIANGFGESFVSSYIDTKIELTERASTWLNGKLVGIKQKLEESEAQLLTYKERYGLIDLGGRVNGINERQIGVLTERLLEAKREMREARLLLREIDEAYDTAASSSVNAEVTLQQVGSGESVNLSVYSELESLPVISGNTLVNRHRLAMLEAERQLGELSNRYGAKHPRVIDAKSNLSTAVVNLDRQISNVIDSVRKRYQLASANVRSLEAEIQQEKEEVHAVGRKQIEMVELEREVEANRALYVKFYNRVREADEAEGMGSVNASLSDPASVSTNPIFPRKRLLVLLGLALSLVGASLAALLLEKKRDTVQGVSDVVKRFGLPVLGVVPMLNIKRARKFRALPLLPGKGKDRLGVFDEAFQTIRSSLYLGSDDCQVILVTSSLPSEGKSTIAVNLAHSMSFMERVVLIDADMRRPSIGRALGAHKFGLYNILSNECGYIDCLQQLSPGDLDLISAGTEAHDPLERLSSDSFLELLAELRKDYDRVIIDSAPVGAVSDAMVIGKRVDTAVFVVKADSTHVDDVEVSLGRLQEVGVPISGAIISQVDMSKVVSYGGEYRYRGYYDQYGYSEPAR